MLLVLQLLSVNVFLPIPNPSTYSLRYKHLSQKAFLFDVALSFNYFRDDDRINSFKNCNPFSTECSMRILKYMFAAELFSW